jgi:hypothetical protein
LPPNSDPIRAFVIRSSNEKRPRHPQGKGGAGERILT